MTPTKVTERIKNKALGLLEQYPEGLRFSELLAKLKESDATFKHNTIYGCIYELGTTYTNEVYKPALSRCLFLVF